MEVLMPHSEDGENCFRSPIIEVPTEKEHLQMHWFNTRIRTFTGNEQFNHVEHRADDGTMIGFQEQELMDKLMEHDFPMLDLPYVDTGTFNWLARGLLENMDVELGEIE